MLRHKYPYVVDNDMGRTEGTLRTDDEVVRLIRRLYSKKSERRAVVAELVKNNIWEDNRYNNIIKIQRVQYTDNPNATLTEIQREAG